MNIKIIEIPKKCPCCGAQTKEIKTNDSMSLICTNPDCTAKKIGKFVHFCERDCMNIVGLSEETLTKFVEKGFIHTLRDIYMLDSYKAQIISMEGFGEKAYENIINAIEKSKTTDFVSFIHACGIPNIGKGQAKLLRNFLDSKMSEYLEDYEDADGSYDLMGCLAWLVWQVDGFNFTCVDGFGDVISKSLNKWVNEELVDNYCRYIDTEVSDVLKFLTFTDEPLGNSASSISGKTFVITGSLNHYKNRDELVNVIESLGGKVSGSVSKNTDFLINNDTASESGKNKKAKELNIPIISEDEFADLLGRIH